MTSAQKSKAKKRAKEAEKRDRDQEKKMSAANEYESLIYYTKDFVSDDENAPYLKNADEKDKLLMFLEQQEDWLYGEGSKADYTALKNKIKVLDKKINPLKNRKQARDILPDEFAEAYKNLKESEKSFKRYLKDKDWLPEEEIDNFKKIVSETRKHLTEKEQEFKDAPLNEKPPITTTTIKSKVKEVTDALKAIKKLRKPKAAQKEVKSKGDLVEAPEHDHVTEVS